MRFVKVAMVVGNVENDDVVMVVLKVVGKKMDMGLKKR